MRTSSVSSHASCSYATSPSTATMRPALTRLSSLAPRLRSPSSYSSCQKSPRSCRNLHTLVARCSNSSSSAREQGDHHLRSEHRGETPLRDCDAIELESFLKTFRRSQEMAAHPGEASSVFCLVLTRKKVTCCALPCVLSPSSTPASLGCHAPCATAWRFAAPPFPSHHIYSPPVALSHTNQGRPFPRACFSGHN